MREVNSYFKRRKLGVRDENDKKKIVETVDGGAMNDSSGSYRIEEDENKKKQKIVSIIDTNRNTMKKTKKQEIGYGRTNMTLERF
ncbi:unnamed protein product [Tenebrio molitor]|nr:unnamed protein product [Tenebrio molitor]